MGLSTYSKPLIVLAQDFHEPYDHILIDDGSEIDVIEAIRDRYPAQVSLIKNQNGDIHFQAPQKKSRSIKLIRMAQNSGNDVTPRNVGLLEALHSGSEYLAHIDSDDRMPTDRLRVSCEYLDYKTSTDLVHGRQRCINEHGHQINGSDVEGWFQFQRRFTFDMDEKNPANKKKSKRHGKKELEILQKDNWIHGGSVTYRSNLLLRIGLNNLTPTVRYGADHIFWQKLSHVGTIDYLSYILTEHRLHEGSMTQGGR